VAPADAKFFDLTFLTSDAGAINDLESPVPFGAGCVSAGAGDALSYLGARDDMPEGCTCLGMVTAGDTILLQDPRAAELSLAQCLLARMNLGIPAADYAGNSGSAIWRIADGRFCCVGHLVAVDEEHRSLVIVYRRVFDLLGVGGVEAVEGS
jgi:hypothetical protein